MPSLIEQLKKLESVGEQNRFTTACLLTEARRISNLIVEDCNLSEGEEISPDYVIHDKAVCSKDELKPIYLNGTEAVKFSEAIKNGVLGRINLNKCQ